MIRTSYWSFFCLLFRKGRGVYFFRNSRYEFLWLMMVLDRTIAWTWSIHIFTCSVQTDLSRHKFLLAFMGQRLDQALEPPDHPACVTLHNAGVPSGVKSDIAQSLADTPKHMYPSVPTISSSQICRQQHRKHVHTHTPKPTQQTTTSKYLHHV